MKEDKNHLTSPERKERRERHKQLRGLSDIPLILVTGEKTIEAVGNRKRGVEEDRGHDG